MKRIAYSNLRLTLRWFSLALILGACCGVQAQQTWPVRPIRLVLPSAAGGSTDILARLMGPRLSKALGQPVIIENRGGAYGVVSHAYVVKSAPDDHMFLISTLTMMQINRYLYPDPGYDPDIDLKSIGRIAEVPNVVVTSLSLPVRTLKEFVEYGKAHADKLSYSSAGVGSAGFMVTLLLEANMGVKTLHVPYSGNGPSLQALLAGDVQFTSDNVTQMLPQLRAGKLRSLAVTSLQRLPQLPEVPTVAEAGFPNMTFSSWWGLVAQSKTSQDVVDRMNRALVAVLQQPDFAAQLRENAIFVLPGTADEMSASLREEGARWKKVFEAAGLKTNKAK